MTTPWRPSHEEDTDDPFLAAAIAIALVAAISVVIFIVALNRPDGGLDATPSTTTEAEVDVEVVETAPPTTAAPVEAAPVDLDVVWAPDGTVSITGQVQSDEQSGALVRSAEAAFGRVDLEDITVDGRGGVDADDEVASLVSIVDAMPRFLVDGEAVLRAGRLSVRGTLASGFDETAFDELLAVAEARGLSVDRELTAPAEVEFGRTYELGPDGVRLTGTVASEDERARLVAEAEGVFDVVVDELVVDTVSLTSGMVSLVGVGTEADVEALRGLTLGGAVVDELVVDEAATAVEDLNALFALEPIQFDVGSADIRAESIPTIDRAAEILTGAVDARVSIEGHTDADGSEDANQTLSEARARAVLDALVERGVAAERLEAVGFGESQPIADNATAEGRAQNRRIAFVLL